MNRAEFLDRWRPPTSLSSPKWVKRMGDDLDLLLRSERDRGIKLAAEVASDYDKYNSHPYLVSDCILGKLNAMKGNPRKNPAAAKIKKALDRLERKLDGLDGTMRFMALASKRRGRRGK